MTESMEQMVREFHLKYGFPVGKRLIAQKSWDGDRALKSTASLLKVCQDELDEVPRMDLRAVRARLMVEELRELVEAMRERDEEAVADGVADLCYVVVGTAVSMGLPVEELVAEVHRSNMTKDVDGELKPRKGSSFSPPNIRRVLSMLRSGGGS